MAKSQTQHIHIPLEWYIPIKDLPDEIKGILIVGIDNLRKTGDDTVTQELLNLESAAVESLTNAEEVSVKEKYMQLIEQISDAQSLWTVNIIPSIT